MKKASRLLKLPIVQSTNQPVVQPIYQTSLFHMPDYETAVKTESAIHPNSYYTRWGNPTVSYLEDQVSLLANKEASLIFPTGMSAITTTLFSLLRPGDVAYISDSLYGDTTRLFLEDLTAWGVKVKTFDPANSHDLLERSSNDKARIVYYETLSNPDLKGADIEGICQACANLGAISICDSTFTPPFVLRDGAQVADIVLMSLTKYLGGHYSAFGGAVSCSASLRDLLWHTQSLFGAAIDPTNAWNISQGMKTLEVRVNRQVESALKIANSLQQCAAVSQVFYPGLSDYRYAGITNKYLKNGGGIVSFIMKDEGKIIQFLEATKLIGLSVSLGGIHSCIEHAAVMSHSMLNAIEDEKISDARVQQPNQGLIRLSVGLEDADDLIADLMNAMKVTG